MRIRLIPIPKQVYNPGAAVSLFRDYDFGVIKIGFLFVVVCGAVYEYDVVCILLD